MNAWQIISTIFNSIISHFNFEIKFIEGRFSYEIFGSDKINFKEVEEETKKKEEEKKVEEEKKKEKEEDDDDEW